MHRTALHAAAILYSTQHCITKLVLQRNVSVMHLHFCKFLLASFMCVIVAGFESIYCVQEYHSIFRNKNEDLKFIFKCFVLSMLTFLSFALQSVGLFYTTASKSAYLLYFNVKLVVLFETLLFSTKYPLKVWVSVVTATIGTSLICFEDKTLNFGDALSLISACFSALFILALDDIQRYQQSIFVVNSIYLSFTTILFFISSLIIDATFRDVEDMTTVSGIMYLSIICFVGQCLQTFGQKKVSTASSALIFALDPVYNLILSYFVLHENLSVLSMVGMLMLTLSILI